VAADQAKVLPEYSAYGDEQQGVSMEESEKVHGTRVASKVVGKVLGVAKRATIVVPQMSLGGPTGPTGSSAAWAPYHRFAGERILDSFIRIMDHVMTPDSGQPDKVGRAVINYSNGEFEDLGRSNVAVYKMFCKKKPVLGPGQTLSKREPALLTRPCRQNPQAAERHEGAHRCGGPQRV
jgi:hypothetical protein